MSPKEAPKPGRHFHFSLVLPRNWETNHLRRSPWLKLKSPGRLANVQVGTWMRNTLLSTQDVLLVCFLWKHQSSHVLKWSYLVKQEFFSEMWKKKSCPARIQNIYLTRTDGSEGKAAAVQANPAVSCGAASCKYWARLLQRLCRQHHLRVVPDTRLSHPQCKHAINSLRYRGIFASALCDRHALPCLEWPDVW